MTIKLPRLIKIACLTFALSLSALPGLPAQALGAKKAAAAPGEDMEIRDKWAIVVGVNRFNDAEIPAQKFAQKSSADLARALKDPDSGHFGLDHVLLVNGKDATKAGIEKAFEQWLYKKALPGDLVIIYFNSRLLKNSAGDPVICAVDSVITDPDKTGINVQELLKTAKQRIGSPHILCMMDCSPMGNSAEKAPHDLKWLANSSGVSVFAASEFNKVSQDDPLNMQSMFLHYFVEALKTGAGNYPLAMTAEYVWQKVQEASKVSGNPQTPILSLASEDSQIVAIPVGIMVRSSLPDKGIAIGHPIENLGMERPDIVAPTLNATKPAIKIQSRAPVNSKTVATAKAPSQIAPPTKTKAVAADDDEEDDFDPNLDLRPYVAKIKQDIQKKWQAPKGFESRRVTTMFSIMRDGKIENASVVESSGNEDVDKSALAALQAASPLDPLPKGSPRSVDLKYVFDWKTKVTTP
ncbi:MAG: TonB C-terminal domain-containing protein [Candidatus Obscuribacterales bacterium]|nr:TonB C-terminal domain-containing protein [Candidatus Obscuribacterales bacterium]